MARDWEPGQGKVKTNPLPLPVSEPSDAARAKADQLTAARGRVLLTAVSALMARDDGWVRAVPQGLEDMCYLKYKFTGGSWKGHYVMVVGKVWDIEQLFALLLQKVDETVRGERKPTLDRYHSGGDA